MQCFFMLSRKTEVAFSPSVLIFRLFKMSCKGLIVIFQLLSIHLCSSEEMLHEKDYCSGEVFNPKCQAGEIVVMEEAFYGRMEISRCIPTDTGYLGCKSNVLDGFDAQCSGKSTCNIFVGDATIPTKGGCMKGLGSYLQASYNCLPEQPNICSTSDGQAMIKLNDGDVYVSSHKLVEKCLSENNQISVQVLEGQNMNVSLISLEGGENIKVFGSIEDPLSEERVPFGGGIRNKHLLESSSHEVVINLQQPSSNFILHFTVHGCRNVLPPVGAWMTRDGDKMELGCHSGSKTWTLHCESGQWIGAVGQCGQYNAMEKENTVQHMDDPNEDLTLDAIVFGVSSLVILLSAVIFLIGVCILKRKIKMKKGAFSVPPAMAHMHQIPNETLSLKQPSHPHDMHMNTGDTSGTGSVQYFVLEDSRKS